MGKRRLLEATLGICTALGVLPLSAPAEAKAKFTVFDVESSDTFAYGINDLGVITGSGGFGKGFLRAVDGTITTFAPPSNFAVLFSRISSAGVVAGYYQDDQSNVRSFVRATDGTITIVNVEGSESTVVYDINAGGTVTGAYGANRGSGFVQAADGTTTTFQVSNDITGGQAINDKGVVTGWYIDHSNVSHGFERTVSGRIKTFDAPGAGTDYGEGTQPVALNSAGAITGWYVDSNAIAHGFVRASDGRFAEFDPTGSIGTYANCLNAKGRIAGFYQGSAQAFHGFVRARDGGIRSFDPPGSISTFAYDVNGTGAIIGYYEDSTGKYHGFLRSP